MHTLYKLILLLAIFIASCADTFGNAVVLGAGTTIVQIHKEHQRVYTEATDSLIDAGLRGDAYLVAVAPMDVEFDERSRVLATAAAVLYGAAAVIDAARANKGDVPATLREAAVDVLHAISDVVDVFTDSHALPPVRLPASLRVTQMQLAAIAHGDAGVADAAQ